MTLPLPSKTEVIHDEQGTHSFKNVYQRVSENWIDGGLKPTEISYPSSSDGSWTNYVGFYPESEAFHGLMKQELYRPQPGIITNWSDLLKESYHDMLPQQNDFVDDILLGAILSELRDVKKMFKFWDKAKSRSRNVSGQVLNYNFAWLPTIKEARALYGMLDSIEKHVREWNAKADARELIVRRRQIRPENIEFSDRTVYDDLVYPQGYSTTFKGTYNKTFTRTVTENWEIAFTLGYIPTRIKQTSWTLATQFVTALGLHKPLSTAWELIPFSFVVDWVANVGDMIETIESNVYGTTAL